VLRGGVKALVEEAGPIVRLHGIQSGDDILEAVGFHGGGAAGAAVEGAAEIVDRLRAFAELADERVGVEPDERALGVIVHGAAVIRVIAAGAIEKLGGDGGVLERAPGASGFVVEIGGGGGEGFAVVFGSPESAA